MKNKSVSKSMNSLLWILQILLAFWFITGGWYMLGNYQSLANAWALQSLPTAFWLALGGAQILFSLGLILPVKIKALPRLVMFSASGLTVISIFGLGIYSAYVGFPGMLWGVLPAALAAFVAYRRR